MICSAGEGARGRQFPKREKKNSLRKGEKQFCQGRERGGLALEGGGGHSYRSVMYRQKGGKKKEEEVFK